MSKNRTQPKVRSLVAINAWQQSGAGTHNPPKRAARRDRRSTKQALRAGRYDS